MLTKNEINRLNRMLENKTFKYSKGLFDYDLPGENDFDFKFQILGYKQMISVGEYYDYLRVSVTLLNFRDVLAQKVFLRLGKQGDFFKKYFKENMYFFRNNLREEIRTIMSMFEPDVRITIEDIGIDTGNEKESLQEQKMTRLPIRTVVKDIVNILKNEGEGDFYLPENDYGHGYEFPKLPFEFNVELEVIYDENLKGYLLNADYSTSDEVIEIVLKLNPSKIKVLMYDIVGELNELVAHELEHGLQNYRGELSNKKDMKLKPLDYYLQSHEIPAQIAGFKRLSKLRKQPFEKIVFEWFNTHKDIHGLNDKEINIVVNKILSSKR